MLDSCEPQHELRSGLVSSWWLWRSSDSESERPDAGAATTCFLDYFITYLNSWNICPLDVESTQDQTQQGHAVLRHIIFNPVLYCGVSIQLGTMCFPSTTHMIESSAKFQVFTVWLFSSRVGQLAQQLSHASWKQNRAAPLRARFWADSSPSLWPSARLWPWPSRLAWCSWAATDLWLVEILGASWNQIRWIVAWNQCI